MNKVFLLLFVHKKKIFWFFLEPIGQRFGRGAAGHPVQELHCVDDGERVAGELGHAADIAGGDEVGACGLDVSDFAQGEWLLKGQSVDWGTDKFLLCTLGVLVEVTLGCREYK